MIETFMFCDLTRFQLVARGTMTRDAAAPLVAAIDALPAECIAVVGLGGLDAVDARAAHVVGTAVRRAAARGVEITISADQPEIVAVLDAAGLADLVEPTTALSL
jgi:anti-anti-sigma regulatory factor